MLGTESEFQTCIFCSATSKNLRNTATKSLIPHKGLSALRMADTCYLDVCDVLRGFNLVIDVIQSENTI